MAGRVRQPIDQKAFEQYLSQNVPEIETPITLKQFGFGQSNPTYQIIAADGRKYVLRKKPPGKLLSKMSHRIEREFQVLLALQDTDVPVPKVHAFCDDVSVIGTMFYIMEHLDGRIFENHTMPDVTPEERTIMWRDAIQVLAKIHAVDLSEVGLEGFGKARGYYDRQIKTWTTICASQEKVVDVETKEPVGRLPYFEECVQCFRNTRLQPKEKASLIHGDYKIDNLVFHPTEPRVIGVLDWEMATIGHPLVDVCNFMALHYIARWPGASPYDTSGFIPGRLEGMPQVPRIVRWYAEESGYDLRRDLNWGMAFNTFKLAAISQGVAARRANRQGASEISEQFSVIREPLVELAWQLGQTATGVGGDYERARM